MKNLIFLFLVFPGFLFANFEAVRVEHYKDANYAYCSFKDRGVIVDLNEVTLTDNCREKVYFGVKDCKQGSPIHWMPDSSEVMVEVIDGYPKLYFLEYFESHMDTAPEHDGLMAKPAHFELDFKHSECYFVQTYDTAGLPFSDDFVCH